MGRPPAVLERLAKTRLVGVSGGSTRLIIVRGDAELLDIDGDDSQAEEAFWKVLDDVARSEPEPGLPDGVKESALKLADSLGRAAPQSLFQSLEHRQRQVRVVAAEVRRSSWTPSATVNEHRGVFAGVLQEGNLRNAKFAIRDDAGNRIRLKQVVDLDEARHLLGERVVVEGTIRQTGSDWTIDGPSQLALQPPLDLGTSPDLATELAKPGPTIPSEDEDAMTEAEFEVFVAAVRGQ